MKGSNVDRGMGLRTSRISKQSRRRLLSPTLNCEARRSAKSSISIGFSRSSRWKSSPAIATDTASLEIIFDSTPIPTRVASSFCLKEWINFSEIRWRRGGRRWPDLTRSFLELPEGRKRYRERFTQLLTNVFAATQVSNRVEQLAAKIRPVLSQLSQSALKAETGLLQERIALRGRDLLEQLAIPELELLSFVEHEASLPGIWRPVDVPEGGRLSRLNSNDGTPSLHISAGPKSAASWRCRVLLGPGKYQFQARAKVSGVEPLGFGRRQGATVRVADEVGAVSGSLVGNRDWDSLAAPISVPGPQKEIELVCELRARRGEVWFDVKSLKLVRLH